MSHPRRFRSVLEDVDLSQFSFPDGEIPPQFKKKKQPPIKELKMQNSPVNNELARNKALSDDLEPREDKEYTCVRTGKGRDDHGETNIIYTITNFEYDTKRNQDTKDINVVQLKDHTRITSTDRRILDAVSTMWIRGHIYFTPSELYQVMYGTNTRPSEQNLMDLQQSVNKLRCILVQLDFTDEFNARLIKDPAQLVELKLLPKKALTDKNYLAKKVVINDNLLSLGAIMMGFFGKQVDRYFIKSEPPLLMYNRIKNTIISIPAKYLTLPVANTEKSVAFQNYLLKRIISYQRGALTQSLIMYETIYQETGIAYPENRVENQRNRVIIKKMMDNWIKTGLIKEYKEVFEEGGRRSALGIEFATEIEKKKKTT